MPRPSLFTADDFLDTAADLVIADGRDALTVRRLSERLGASNGSIYHAFGSIDSLLGQSWLRAARQYLELQRGAVENEWSRGGHGAAVRAVLAAADAPAAFAQEDPRRARLLAALQRDEILTPGLDAETAKDVVALDRALGRLLKQLAQNVWARQDRPAVSVIRTCVVTLPSALLLPRIRSGSDVGLTFARRQLAAAAGAVLECGVRERDDQRML